MTGMKIDLDIVMGWVKKWERDAMGNKTTSQVAAVLLSRALAENQERAARIEKLMNEIFEEYNALDKIEKKIALLKETATGVNAVLLEECKKHKRRMTVMLREADELLKQRSAGQSIRVGGLLLEISRKNDYSKSR